MAEDMKYRRLECRQFNMYSYVGSKQKFSISYLTVAGSFIIAVVDDFIAIVADCPDGIAIVGGRLAGRFASILADC